MEAGTEQQPELERTFRVIALVAAIYVAGVIALFAQGDGIAAAYLAMPASMLGLRVLGFGGRDGSVRGLSLRFVV